MTMIETKLPLDQTTVESMEYDRPGKLLKLMPYALALIVGLAAMRNVTCNNVVSTDASRHAMNGAFVHDLIWSDQLTAPMEFGKQYYSRYPALSIPFHPPVFSVTLAVFYVVFGVNLVAARLAVAVTTGLCAFFFTKLLTATHGSHALAFCCVVTFFSLPTCQVVSTDMMLEFPAMMFVMASIYQLRDLRRGFFPLGRGLAFAVLGGLAVWSKQNSAFLGLVPFLFIVISGQWRLLLGKTIWISSFLFGMFCVSWVAISDWAMPSGTASQFAITNTQAMDHVDKVLWRNTRFYASELVEFLGSVSIAVLVFSLGILIFKKLRGQSQQLDADLYLSWSVAVLALLLVTHQISSRYLLFAIPALVLIGYMGLFHISQRVFPSQFASWAPVGCCLLLFATRVTCPISYLTGPAEAARVVSSDSPKRVLYCGEMDGSFIFAMRSLESKRNSPTTIIRGDKLREEQFEPKAFADFIYEYGIDYVVLERRDVTLDWDELQKSPTASMKLVRELPMVCVPYIDWSGRLFVYRNTSCSPSPKNIMEVNVLRTHRTIDLELSR